MKRAATIAYGSFARALHTAETKKRTPTVSKARLRPSQSATHPPKSELSTVPQSAEEVTQPCIAPERFQSF